MLDRVRSGDEDARDALVRRYLPALQRWARGRLPRSARSMADTDDIVQVSLLRALDRVKQFEYRGQGSFLSYLRQVLKNEIRDRIRQGQRRPPQDSLPATATIDDPSALEVAIGNELLERYEAALAGLSPEQQEAVIMRIELGCTWPEVAEATGSPSANAARMVVTRALTRLAETMDG